MEIHYLASESSGEVEVEKTHAHSCTCNNRGSIFENENHNPCFSQLNEELTPGKIKQWARQAF